MVCLYCDFGRTKPTQGDLTTRANDLTFRMISSANILAGMSWWQSWLCVWIGYSIAGIFICLTGKSYKGTRLAASEIVSRAMPGVESLSKHC